MMVRMKYEEETLIFGCLVPQQAAATFLLGRRYFLMW